ncbi:MAG: lipoate--protein ligase family protein [Haloarculaceae archaeon]
MRVLRGRASTVEEDRAVTRALAGDVEGSGEPVVRAWRPHRQVAFGRRDARSDGYTWAKRAAEERGFPTYERDVGGRAVAYTGNTVAFVRIEPVEELRRGTDERYDRAVSDVRGALRSLGVEARAGEPPDAFCPGAHSLSTAAGKLVGIAQRVRQGSAAVAGIVVVRDHEEIAAVLDPVYGTLGVPFDPDTVGSVATSGGPADPTRVARGVESALVGGREERVERVR